MPLYPYLCNKCGHRFELIRKFSDSGRERCPECEAELTTEQRLVGKTSFKLDSSGWYAEGYSTKENKYTFQD